MKRSDSVKTKIPKINLENFESPESFNSPYVLTSPRSLKACKKVGIKPVELLYRSSQDIAIDLGVSQEYVQKIYHQQETDRLRKLEMCRRIRGELKTKQNRFNIFFQKRSQNDKNIQKCNNAKYKNQSMFKNRFSLPTDSDESRYSPIKTNSFHSNVVTDYYSNKFSHTEKSNVEFSTREISCHKNNSTLNVPHQSVGKANHMKSSQMLPPYNDYETTQWKEVRNIRNAPHDYCFNSTTTSPNKKIASPKTHHLSRSVDHSNTPEPIGSYSRKYGESEISCPKQSNSKYPTEEFVHRNKTVRSSLHSQEEIGGYPDEMQHSKMGPTIKISESKSTASLQKKYEASDSCASVSSLTPDPIEDRTRHTGRKELIPCLNAAKFKETHRTKNNKTVENSLNGNDDDGERGKDSERNTSTSSDKEEVKSIKRMKMKQKENGIEESRKTQSLPRFESNDEIKNRNSDVKKRIHFKKDICIKYSTNSDSSSCGSKKTSYSNPEVRKKYKTKLKKSKDLSNNYSTDSEGYYYNSNSNLSEQDRRILESLAMKKRQEIQNEQKAYEAHKRWEEDKRKYEKKQKSKEQEWRSFVDRKRKMENNINAMRMEEVKENLRQAQKLLEMRLTERNKKIEDIIKQSEQKKVLDTFQKREHLEKKRFLAEANHLQKELERMMQYEECEHELTEKLKRAEKLRETGLRNFHKKVANANRLEEIKHQERMEELLEEDNYLRNQKIKELQEREDKVIHRYMEQVRQKLQNIKQNSLTRELKSQQARQTVRDLEEGLETWQDHVMLMQWDALRRSEANAKILLANRRLRVECENKERMLQHSRRFREKKMDESRKLRSIIEEIKQKEDKIKCLQRTRDREITECRLRAHSAAELREQIRNTLTPETFDSKVKRVNLELRVSSRPPSASPTLMRSHIRLG